MITPREIEEKTMTPEKRQSAKNNYFAFYIGRPITYVLTVPFLYTSIKPNTISLISIVPCILGFLFMGLGTNTIILVCGWFCFFLWSLLDGVDGNVARYRQQFSSMGEIYDALSGYAALALLFFGCGWAASHQVGLISYLLNVPSESYIVIGALSSIFALYSRLIVHKAESVLKSEESTSEFIDRPQKGIIGILATNLSSVSGFMQILMLIAIIFHILDLFSIGYCILNFLIMLYSLSKCLNKDR